MAGHELFIGRQPIYDRTLEVYAYELLFRAGDAANAVFTDGDLATSQVLIGTVMDIGLENIVGDRRAFINLSEGFLTGRFPLPLSPRQVVLEILETIAPEPEVLATLADFRRRGYTIALDDFVLRPEREALVSMASIVKLDVLALSPAELEEQVARLRPSGVRLLAEKVETHEQFAICQALGFDYFQGYFLCRPNVVRGRGMSTNRPVLLKLLAELQDPEVDPRDLERTIALDVNLAYRLLRLINSAAFGLRREVTSLRQALLLLGTHAVRNWASLLLLARIDDKPRELMTIAQVRAHMCEQLSTPAQELRGQGFMLGLFSVLDALMDRPLSELLDALPLPASVAEALTGRGGPLAPVLAAVLDYERGNWSQLASHEPERLRAAYLNALRLAGAAEAALREKACQNP